MHFLYHQDFECITSGNLLLFYFLHNVWIVLYMLVDEMLQALVHEMCDETEVAVLKLKASLSAITA